MDIDEKLRAQSKLLLQKLKARQGKLQKSLAIQDSSGLSSREESLVEATLMKSARKNGLQYHSSTERKESVDLDSSTTALKPDSSLKSKVRSDLTKPKVHSLENKENFNDDFDVKEMNSKSFEGKDNENTRIKQRYLYEKDTEVENRKVSTRGKSPVSEIERSDQGQKAGARSRLPQGSIHSKKSSTRSPKSRSPKRKSDDRSKTPNTIARRRKIIDKHVKVDSALGDSDLERTLNQSGLNYSYSNFDESDCEFVQERLRKEREEEEELSKRRECEREEYTDKLMHAGNDKEVARMIRESQKPKSILSNGSRSLKKSLSKVSFLTSGDSSSFNSELMDPDHTRQLLGYDWIAALLDNNHRVMDNSEAYFEELREFRRLNRDACQNQFYMEGPEALFYETTDREPSTIKEILEDNKVKPYTVNKRLFTEPIKKSMFPGEEEVDKEVYDEPKKVPTYEDPRFVRVSIPRSTLASPHRVKPHRRKSLDGEDTMALSQHCQMGYESSVPSMVPAASNLGLRDATTGIKSKMQTTMAEAEKIASSFPYPWNTTSTTNDLRKPTRTDLYQSHLDMTLPYSMRSDVSGSRSGEESLKLKRATEDLLNSTYSLMYEMENMKRDRELQNSRLGRI